MNYKSALGQTVSRILVVEDEIGLSGVIKEWLEDEHYVVTLLDDGHKALQNILSQSYELIVLDWMLPGVDGVTICSTFRHQGGKTPVLLLTAKATMTAKEQGLDSGADDYLTKPFDLRELSARVRALLRRPQTLPKAIYSIGDITLDMNSRRATRGSHVLKLLPKEFILLEVLMRHEGTVMSAEDLIDHVWGTDSDIAPDTVRSHVKALRKKIDIEGQASIIRTVHGMGYMMENS